MNSAEDPLRFPNSSFTIQKDEMTNDKVIIFSTVSDQDEGDYYCVAENKAGTVQGNPVSISVGEFFTFITLIRDPPTVIG